VVDDGSAVDYSELRSWWEAHCPKGMGFSWVRKPNGGKKSAHVRTFTGDNTDVFVTVDSVHLAGVPRDRRGPRAVHRLFGAQPLSGQLGSRVRGARTRPPARCAAPRRFCFAPATWLELVSFYAAVPAKDDAERCLRNARESAELAGSAAEPDQIAAAAVVAAIGSLPRFDPAVTAAALVPSGDTEPLTRVRIAAERARRAACPRRRVGVPGWVTGLLGQASAREKLDIVRQCKTIYVGSPLYTAR
jgi:hypothetical protein